MAEHETTFEGYSYRTSCRFGSRVKVSVDGETVSVTGPRVGVFTYRLWFSIQLVLLWLIPPVLLAGVPLWDWRYLVLASGTRRRPHPFGVIGVASFWELAIVSAVQSGSDQGVSFPLSAVKRVKIGHG